MSELIDERPESMPGNDQREEPRPSGTDVTGGVADELPLSDRLGHNPGNLGDDVADLGDITHPTPEPGSPQM
ncbi:hypothetical protein BH24CHL7_BH24CHL7_07660 [soil metagenome]|jgi:hypothetical protein